MNSSESSLEPKVKAPKPPKVEEAPPQESEKSEKEVALETPVEKVEDKPFHFEYRDIDKIAKRNQEYQQAREARRSLGLAPESESTASEEAYLDDAERYIQSERREDIKVENLESNTEYFAELERPDFQIGTAVNFDMLFSDRDEMLRKYPGKEREIDDYIGRFNDDYKEAYTDTLEQNFNGVVAENTFKWGAMEGADGEIDYSQTDKVMEFLRSRPELLENFRGHNIFWNITKNLPEHLRGKSKEDIKRDIIEKRLDVLRRYPEIKEWDLLNEPLSREPRLDKNGVNQDEAVFDPEEDFDFFVDLFKRAKEVAPDTKLYINEYSILSGKKTGDYISFIQRLREAGAPVDGIGVQGHITEYGFSSIGQMKQNLDDLSRLELPIKITEFDVSDEVIEKMYFPLKEESEGGDRSLVEKARADYTRKAMTIFYGTPKVEGVYLWGFQDKSHWRGMEGEHVGLFDNNFQPNQVGQAFQNLIQEQWTTNVDTVSNDQGQLDFKGFPGVYKVYKK